MQLPGANRIIRRSKTNGVTIDWYLHRGRGAPRLASYRGATLAEAERAEAAGADKLASAYGEAIQPKTGKNFVAGLIVAYKESPAWKNLRPSTQRNWKRWLDQIHTDFGDLSVKAMASKGARALILDWRDKYADTPRTADYAMQVLSRVLSWAKDRELIDRNPAEGIERLYDADRSDQIWEPKHIKAALAKAPAHVGHAIELLAHTGLRLGDMVALTWDAVDTTAGEIVWATSKSNGKREAVIPITKELRRVLKAIPRHGDIVLTTAGKTPWSSGNALSHAIQSAATGASVKRRTHDLRGTAVTNLVTAGLSYPQVAMIVAWSEAEVERIARRYVSKGAVSRAIARKINSVAEAGRDIEPKPEN
ncbi:MAG: tyrosine-type recombinase/integrase [Hyphomonadaceae bacterium]|nr:tyrosine-type recombinase/integrase [Hyphomonadaceae bacterium]